MTIKDTKPGEKPEHNIRIFQERLKYLKRGQEYNKADDIPKAVECYSQYLNCLATYFSVDEKKLTPTLFDPEKDVAEMLLISHVYWDLSKAYDRSPNLRIESVRCLDQFVKFTVGFKYQYVNARMLRNFIRKRLAHNPKAFKQAYDRIQVESKSCYIATYALGDIHPITQQFRLLKTDLNKSKPGRSFIDFYYRISPVIINYLNRRPKAPLNIFFIGFSRLILRMLSKLISPKYKL